VTAFFEPTKLRAVLTGSWIAKPGGRHAGPAPGVSIDSRTVGAGEAFIAIRGDRFDGHDFLDAALAAGAGMLVIDQTERADDETLENYPGVGVLRVPDTRKALMRLAGAYRKSLDGVRVVGVTGSNGKTTAVRMIDAVLRQRFQGHASPKSFNNDIGVPLTILGAKPTDQYAVCEAGINAPGEMAPLARIIEPDIAVVTSIGHAHIEEFGTTEAIAREKSMLLSHLRPHGLAVVNGDARELDTFLRPVANVVTFGRGESCDLRLTSASHTTTDDGAPAVTFSVNDRATFTVPVLGLHNASNALAAVAVGRRMGLDDAEIARGLATVEPPPMRFAVEDINGVRVFNDAYNASPESATAAIDAFAELTRGADRRVAVMGDMLELGDASPDLHREVGEHLIDTVALDALITVGPMSLFTADVVSDAATESGRSVELRIHSDMSVEVARRVAARLRPGDAVLVKGSRRLGLERVIEALRSQPPASSGSTAAPTS
jgi:UDP-N-acetylmuramoyl-tripeptide--D-alanyl-D-alanine ligase